MVKYRVEFETGKMKRITQTALFSQTKRNGAAALRFTCEMKRNDIRKKAFSSRFTQTVVQYRSVFHARYDSCDEHRTEQQGGVTHSAERAGEPSRPIEVPAERAAEPSRPPALEAKSSREPSRRRLRAREPRSRAGPEV